MDNHRNVSERFRRGLETRRKVLGDRYVDRALADATEFSWEMQVLTTEWCWDGCWNRPGLDHRSRSLVNLGLLAAQNRPYEFKVHVRGALNNGITRDEIKEILLQIGAYCGVPTAMDCFRVVSEVLAECEQSSG